MGVAWMTEARFLARTARVGDCLIWQGKGRIGPYGVVGYQGRHWLAHRLAWFFANGPIPPDTVIRHSCDTPLCVEPTHLLSGTQGDNIADKVARGRQHRGESHPAHVLTLDQVLMIRDRVERGERQKDLAAEFGVSKQQVSRIVRGIEWKGD